jgi:hypothetical protein
MHWKLQGCPGYFILCIGNYRVSLGISYKINPANELAGVLLKEFIWK